MNDAERFAKLRDAVWARWQEYKLSNEESLELIDFLDTMEERWELFSE